MSAIRQTVFSIFLWAGVFLFCGCSSIDPKNLDEGPTVAFDWNRPLRVAVMPFGYESSLDLSSDNRDKAAPGLRSEFFRSFSLLSFEDIELHVIDHYLEQSSLGVLGILSETNRTHLASRIGEGLAADLLLFADVSKYNYHTVIAREKWTVGLTVQMVDVVSGGVVWELSENESKQELHLPLSPGGFAGELIDVLTRDQTFDEVCRELCGRVTAVAPRSSFFGEPVLQGVRMEPDGRSVRPGDKVKIIAVGTPGMRAVAELGNKLETISLVEESRGTYSADYRLAQDAEQGTLGCSVQLQNTLGPSSDWFRVENPVCVDRTPPNPPMASISAESGSLRVKWGAASEKDVSLYRVFRSTSGKGGFAPVQDVQNNCSFRDENVTPFKRYFYAVKAVDHAGNESRFSAPVTAAVLTPGPHRLSGDEYLLPEELFREASPYILHEKVVIPKGHTLRIEAGTVIQVENGGSLQVEGMLSAEGTGEESVGFFATEEGPQPLLVFKPGSSGRVEHCTFEGFQTCFRIEDAEVSVGSCVLAGNNQGVIAEKGANVKLDACRFENNQAVLKARTQSTVIVLNCNFVRNGLNILLADQCVSKMENNWWGLLPETISAATLGVKGDLEIERCLDAPYPEGMSIATTALPLLGEFNRNGGDILRLNICRRLVDHDPRYKRGHLWIADCLQTLLQWEGALQVLQKALLRFPGDPALQDAIRELESLLGNVG